MDHFPLCWGPNKFLYNKPFFLVLWPSHSDFTDARRRESEKSLENETSNKEEDCQSPTSKPPKPEQPLKVMPAPPPKENAWVKRSSNPPARSQSSDTEQQSPTRWVSLEMWQLVGYRLFSTEIVVERPWGVLAVWHLTSSAVFALIVHILRCAGASS